MRPYLGLVLFAVVSTVAAHSSAGEVKAGAPAPAPAPPPSAAAANPYVNKPVTVRPAVGLPPADKARVQQTFATALAQFKKDGDEKKLAAAGAGLNGDLGRAFRRELARTLVAKKRPELAASVTAPKANGFADYRIISGVISGYLKVDCGVTWTVDFVIKNNGTSAPPPDPNLVPYFFDQYENAWAPYNSVRLPAINPGQTTTVRYEFKRDWALYAGAHLVSCGWKPDLTQDIGYASFSPAAGAALYDLQLVNGAFFLTAAEQ